MIYITSDIHGEYDQLMQLLEKVSFSDKDMLYVLGDVIDRGPKSIETLEYMMEHKNIIPLVGNHEVMGVVCLRYLMETPTDNVRRIDPDMLDRLYEWKCNGGVKTADDFYALSPDKQKMLIDYLENFSMYEVLFLKNTYYVLVHAGLGNFTASKQLMDYTVDELVWDRPDYQKAYFNDAYVVTGHTPTQLIEGNDKPGYIYRKNNHIALDCGACFPDGRLAMICLDTGEEFYSR